MTMNTCGEKTISSLLLDLAPEEGYNLTSLPSVRVLRSNRPLSRTPVLYDPGIVIVGQGCKRGYFGDQVYQYDAQQYLAVSAPVPFTMETDASLDKPLLAMYCHLDFALASELMFQIDQHGGPPDSILPRSMMSSPMNKTLSECVLRFLGVLSQPLEAAVLGPILLKELYFHFLTGQQGGVLRSALSMQGHFGKINQVLRLIHARYNEALSIAELAEAVAMSKPSFHQHFKSVTDHSPIQYIKSVRLHQARLLMARQKLSALSASQAVGYESPSQFNREFKRLFGLPPKEEVARMQMYFSIPPGHKNADFISSH